MDTIHFESVSKVFRRGHFLFNRRGNRDQQPTCALREVSICVAPGEVLALLGPNGSGKTTLLKLISTVLLPDAGRVMVGGQDTRTAGASIRKRIGFVVASERSFFPRLSARENLDFFAALDDVPRADRRGRIDRLLSQVGLHEQSNILAMKFSTGMYQRLGIARALLKKPSVVLLDEPTRSLDPAAAVDFWDSINALRDEGATVIVATHNFDEAAALSDSVAILQRGRLLQHATLRRSTSQQLRSLYLDVTAEPTNSVLAAVGSWQ
jgi:ABC-2 type transport system ATP-binding protein